jgi:hypothetical protein
LLHWSWGRTPAEVRQKLENWGHSGDFNIEKFFSQWESVTLENYTQFRNLHPLNPPLWERLELVKLG